MLTKNEIESNIPNIDTNKIFGFWIYLMSDCIIFATLFATYSVMVNNIAHGPKGKDIFDLYFVLIETFALLISSITCGMVLISMNNQKNKIVIINWLFLTFLFGVIFISMEVYEFYKLIKEGFGPNKSGFLSSFFTLVGTHGFHVLSGLIWILVLIAQLFKFGLIAINKTRIICFSLFWHFLDVIWICVFTVVYLIGVM
ncbi:MAG: cytochrome o ubiquinol oxidase subunit III [Pantoea sp. Brub]|nr:cytochrome o ubiquinol oxidase subunit III [Pantoea sp. Brub]